MVVIIIEGETSPFYLVMNGNLRVESRSLSDVIYTLDSKFSELKLWSRLFVWGDKIVVAIVKCLSHQILSQTFFVARLSTLARP